MGMIDANKIEPRKIGTTAQITLREDDSRELAALASYFNVSKKDVISLAVEIGVMHKDEIRQELLKSRVRKKP